VTVLAPPVRVGDDGFAPAAPTAPFGSEVRDILTRAGFAGPALDRLLGGGAVTPRGPRRA